MKTQFARLTEPMVRDGDRLRVATWKEAIECAAAGIASAVKRGGPNAFGLFSCSKTTNELNFLTQKFARAVVGCNNIDSCNRT
jgi:formate dehydrogenase major subunit